MQLLNSKGDYTKDKCAKTKVRKPRSHKPLNGQVKVLMRDGIKLDVPEVLPRMRSNFRQVTHEYLVREINDVFNPVCLSDGSEDDVSDWHDAQTRRN